MRRLGTFAPWPLIRGAVTLAVLLLVLRGLDLGQVGGLFREFKLPYLVFALLLGVGANLLAGFAWKALLDALAVRLSLLDVVRFYAMGLFFNIFTPGGVAGDAVRIHQLHRKTARGIEGFTSILISRVLSIITLLLVGAGAAAVVLPGLPSSRLAFTLLVGSSVGLLLLMLLNRPLQPLLLRLPEGGLKRLVMRVLASLELLPQRPGPLTRASVFFTVHHLLVVLSVYLAALALDLHIPFPWMLALVPLARVLVLLPVSISGLGVQEAAFVVLFAQVGVGAPAAFSVSLLSHLVLMVVPLSGGLVFLLGRGRAGSKGLPRPQYQESKLKGRV
ncbi:MAG: YbhN family protein [Dehalococcoidia bacterium]